jgi:hypothetical protein
MTRAVAILSQKRQDHEYFARLEKGLEIYRQQNLDYIILLSESANDTNIQYLQNQGIIPSRILMEPLSRDTIGEATLVRQNIVIPYKIKELYVISSDYHINYRVKAIYNYIFAQDSNVKINYSEVKTAKGRDPDVILDQLKSIAFFVKIIESSKSDNLLDCHPLYKNI